MSKRTFQPHHLSLAAALIGAATISFSAILYALAEVTPTTGAFYRVAYAAPVLFLLWLVRRRLDNRPMRRRWIAAGAGLALGADIVSWNVSIDYIGAGLAALVVNTSVVFVAIGAWLFFDERPRRATLLSIPVILVGVGLVSGVGQGATAFGTNPVLGTLFALMGAAFYATFILTFRFSNDERAPVAGPLLEATLGTVAMTLILGLISGGIDFSITWPAHGWLLVLALGPHVVGWLLIGYALPRLPAAEAATVILLQPALTMIWGAIIFDERPSPLQIAGALIVLTGVGVVSWTRARRGA